MACFGCENLKHNADGCFCGITYRGPLSLSHEYQFCPKNKAALNAEDETRHSQQQAKHKITPFKCANYDRVKCTDPTWCSKCGNCKPA